MIIETIYNTWNMEEGGSIMLAAVKGYYDGNQIIVNEDDRKNLNVGDELIITILDKVGMKKTETRAEKRRRIIDTDAYVVPTGRTVEEIDDYMKEMRSDDRF